MKHTIGFLVLLGVLITPVRAQRWERPIEERPPMTMLLHEAIVFPPSGLGEQGATVRVDIPYRVNMDFFISLRSRNAPIVTPFAKEGEITIELFDSTEGAVGRTSRDFALYSAAGEPDPQGKEWIQGISTFSLQPGKYRILIEVTDLQSKRFFSDRQKTIAVPLEAMPGHPSPAVFFTNERSSSAGGDTLSLENMGGDFLFGVPGSGVVVVPPGFDPGTTTLSYTILETDRDRKEPGELVRTIPSRVVSRQNMQLVPLPDSTRALYAMRAGGTVNLIEFEIPLAELKLRSFVLDVALSSGRDTSRISVPCKALWPDMPQSIRDVDQALEALRLLLPEDVVDRMKKGNFAARRDSLEAFWYSREHKKGSAYNDLMAEFYRRIDETRKTYGTLRQPDGLKSDRGRVFVLFGPPSSTERSLNPAGAFREVWRYDRINRTFLFEDRTRSGNYVLIPQSGS